jgi:hypothetical protein
MTEVFQLGYVPPPRLGEVWNGLLATLHAFPDTWNNEQTVESIFGGLISGKFQLWLLVDHEGAVHMTLLTRIRTYPVGDVMEIVWGAGHEADVAIHSIDALEREALAQGCVELRIQGRPAWLRLLKDKGYEFQFQVIGKAIMGPGKGN